MSLSKPQQPAKTVTLPKLNQTPDIRRVFRSWRDVFLAQVNSDKDIRDLLSGVTTDEALSQEFRALETSDQTLARTMQPRDSDLIPREKIRVRAYLRHVESNKNGKQRLYACLMSCLDSPLRLFIKNCIDRTGCHSAASTWRRITWAGAGRAGWQGGGRVGAGWGQGGGRVGAGYLKEVRMTLVG